MAIFFKYQETLHELPASAGMNDTRNDSGGVVAAAEKKETPGDRVREPGEDVIKK